jgi:hypothetical protein
MRSRTKKKRMKRMISKEEFIKLYCDEFIYKATGVIGIMDKKVAHRLKVDALRTQQDLEDYGYPLSDVEFHGEDVLMTWDVDSLGSGSRRKEHEFFDALQREIENLTSSLGSGRRSPPRKEFDPDNFDWGGEDSIK